MKLLKVLWNLLWMNYYSKSTTLTVLSPKWFLSHSEPEIGQKDDYNT